MGGAALSPRCQACAIAVRSPDSGGKDAKCLRLALEPSEVGSLQRHGTTGWGRTDDHSELISYRSAASFVDSDCELKDFQSIRKVTRAHGMRSVAPLRLTTFYSRDKLPRACTLRVHKSCWSERCCWAQAVFSSFRPTPEPRGLPVALDSQLLLPGPWHLGRLRPGAKCC